MNQMPTSKIAVQSYRPNTYNTHDRSAALAYLKGV